MYEILVKKQRKLCADQRAEGQCKWIADTIYKDNATFGM